ncbi:MAG: NAD-dependent epimerase/dehydratase family protein [Myxococcota bacterium]|nr:NAD-dependent epimerase/dehydratase family protein [Myxococcota bacterium]
MRVFVTGGTGYIGAAVARCLKSRGHHVTILVRRDEAEIAARAAGYDVIRGGLEDASALAKGALEADATVHAATTGDDHRAAADLAAVRAVVGATRGSGKRFIYTGGCWSYGNTGSKAADELTSTAGATPLSAWRNAVEDEVAAAAGHNLRVVIMRPAVVYGDMGGLVGMMAESAKKQGVLRYVGTPTTRWTFIHLVDLANLYAQVVERTPEGATILNAASDQVLPLGEVALAVARALRVDRVEPWAVDDARKTLGAFADALALDQNVSGKKARQMYKWAATQPGVIADCAGFARL